LLPDARHEQAEVSPLRILPAVGRRHWLPLGFVIVLLFALVAIPIASERRVRGYEVVLNEEVEPARTHLTEFRLQHGMAGCALRDYLITGEQAALVRYEEAVRGEQRALLRLEPLVSRLNGTIQVEYAALTDGVEQLRREVAAALQAGEPAVGAGPVLRSDLDMQVLQAAAHLDRELASAGDALRLQIRAAKQQDVQLALVLLFLATAATLIVGWSGRRLHRNAVLADRARKDLLRVNESRARLIRGFSHDVKNPLSGADGYAQLLEAELLGDLTEEQARGVRRMRAALQAALGLIDDLVDLARAEAGQIELRVERYDLAELVREVVEEYRASAEARSQDLRLERPASPVSIESDRPRVRQILSNLLSNAIKYTQEGGTVTVGVRYAPARRQPDPRRWALAYVADNGPGIPPDRQHLLFREFTRLHPTESHGAGLGLAISQGLAQALNGQITVDSAPGKGSTFTLWLPDAPEQGAAPASGS
jgi:signal transduction histidine kinase